jgi:hypothetical protein
MLQIKTNKTGQGCSSGRALVQHEQGPGVNPQYNKTKQKKPQEPTFRYIYVIFKSYSIDTKWYKTNIFLM